MTSVINHPYIFLCVFICIAGCGSTPSQKADSVAQPTIIASERPLATWSGQRIISSDLEPMLLEMSGDLLLREYVLSMELERAAVKRKIVLDADALTRERELLTQSMAGESDQAERLLMQIRSDRGLGPERFSRMLRRLAILRAIVSPEVDTNEELVIASWDAVHGPRRTARVIVVDDVAQAESIRNSIENGDDFITLAAEQSLDPSAPRGGLLAPISRHDRAWPEEFRRSLYELDVDEISPPLAIDGRYLLVRLESESPASGITLEEGRQDAENIARQSMERLMMDREARRIMEQSTLTIIDKNIRWREQQ